MTLRDTPWIDGQPVAGPPIFLDHNVIILPLKTAIALSLIHTQFYNKWKGQQIGRRQYKVQSCGTDLIGG